MVENGNFLVLYVFGNFIIQYYLVLIGFPLTPKQVTLSDLEWPFYVCDDDLLHILQTNSILKYFKSYFARRDMPWDMLYADDLTIAAVSPTGFK